MEKKLNDLEDRKYPVYVTQGGGYAREVNGKFIFITDPNCPGIAVGDEVPEEWDIQPVNQLARDQFASEEYTDDELWAMRVID
ncbi:MAG: hypothetical protein IPK84_04230 [Candidatus Moraniibacteriota bacterium]|nr:MAG: hypothetical protein IPK84_04230 [Candidatus Moranbacteria bacterium]